MDSLDKCLCNFVKTAYTICILCSHDIGLHILCFYVLCMIRPMLCFSLFCVSLLVGVWGLSGKNKHKRNVMQSKKCYFSLEHFRGRYFMFLSYLFDCLYLYVVPISRVKFKSNRFLRFVIIVVPLYHCPRLGGGLSAHKHV